MTENRTNFIVTEKLECTTLHTKSRQIDQSVYGLGKDLPHFAQKMYTLLAKIDQTRELVAQTGRFQRQRHLFFAPSDKIIAACNGISHIVME